MEVQQIQSVIEGIEVDPVFNLQVLILCIFFHTPELMYSPYLFITSHFLSLK